ncbi:MAG: EipA family protein [Solidesulfovibrio sp. DCME]|uniref:EipA family protein n=1 Tax=Solidesulfovibrio sp. DCME TaxID=3447380 RepID=UPI003D09D991
MTRQTVAFALALLVSLLAGTPASAQSTLKERSLTDGPAPAPAQQPAYQPAPAQQPASQPGAATVTPAPGQAAPQPVAAPPAPATPAGAPPTAPHPNGATPINGQTNLSPPPPGGTPPPPPGGTPPPPPAGTPPYGQPAGTPPPPPTGGTPINGQTNFTPPPPPPPPLPTRQQTYNRAEVNKEVMGFFESGSRGLAEMVARAFNDLGQPTGFIKGNEAGGALVVGLRYGTGTLNLKGQKPVPVYWQSPSLGLDLGVNAVKVFTLVYGTTNPNEIFQRFPGVDGSAYILGGFGMNYQRSDQITLAPIRFGVGLRLGANVGYQHYTRTQEINPF